MKSPGVRFSDNSVRFPKRTSIETSARFDGNSSGGRNDGNRSGELDGSLTRDDRTTINDKRKFFLRHLSRFSRRSLNGNVGETKSRRDLGCDFSSTGSVSPSTMSRQSSYRNLSQRSLMEEVGSRRGSPIPEGEVFDLRAVEGDGGRVSRVKFNENISPPPQAVETTSPSAMSRGSTRPRRRGSYITAVDTQITSANDEGLFEGFTGIRMYCNMPFSSKDDSNWGVLRGVLRNLSMRDAKEEAEKREGQEGETALHLVCRQNPPIDIIEKLFWASLNVATWPTYKSKWLPLHVLCYRGATDAVFRRVIQANPDARVAVDSWGQTPLHLYTRNSNAKLSFSCLSQLMVPQIVHMRDKWKKLPITMKKICELAEKLQPEQIDEKQDALKCAVTFLDGKLENLQAPSVRSASELIALLDGSPEWFKCHVMVHPYVKAMLNWRITRNFPTSVMMLDFYVLIVLIVFFRMVSFTSLDARISQSEEHDKAVGGFGVVMLYLGVFYLFLREVLQMASLAYTGDFADWVFDIWNWLDCMCIGTVLKTTVHMHSGTGEDEHLRYLVIVTTGILWMMMLSFLKLTRHNFAVFVTGVIHVAWTVSSFIFMLSMILLAFAQMFATKYQGSSRCEKVINLAESLLMFHDDDTEPPIEHDFCTKYGSYLKVYTMLISGAVDEADFVHDRGSMWISIAFSFLVVLLLNLLIAVITDSYSDVKNHGDIVFWSHRLGFVYEVDHIGDMIWVKNEEEDSKSKSTHSNQEQSSLLSGEANIRSLSMLWEIALVIYEDPSVFSTWKTRMSLSERWNGPRWILGEMRNPENHTFDFFTDARQKIFFVFFVPIWIFSGFLTAGLLWPPQVRHWLFCPDVVEANKVHDTLSSDELGKAQREIKTEIKKVEATMDNKMESLNTRMVAMDGEISEIKGEVGMMKDNMDQIKRDFYHIKDTTVAVKNLLGEFLPGKSDDDARSVHSRNSVPGKRSLFKGRKNRTNGRSEPSDDVRSVCF